MTFVRCVTRLFGQFFKFGADIVLLVHFLITERHDLMRAFSRTHKL